MPDILVEFGGRTFELQCAEGEETAILSAAERLDKEAQILTGAMGRIPESRLLLLAGILVADKALMLENRFDRMVSRALSEEKKKSASAVERLKQAEAELTRAKVRIADIQAQHEEEIRQAKRAGETTAEMLAMVEMMVERAESAANSLGSPALPVSD